MNFMGGADMRVNYIDLKKQFQDEALWMALKAQFESCQFILGPEVKVFEAMFAKLCGVSHALGVNSGTDALFLAMKALNIGPGDEVITVPNSFIATTGAIMAAGARPVFVDVGEDYNMDVRLIRPAITRRTKAILPVHLTGNPADMTGILDVAGENALFVVEDAAQAVGASVEGRPTGSFGTIGCFSLHPLKNLNICGDGGVLVTDDDDICTRVALLRNHGLRNRDEIDCFGYNCRMDTLQAVVACHVMNQLEEITRKRRENASIYRRELTSLADFISLPPECEGKEPVYHTFVVQAERRDELVAFLQNHAVETKIHYPVPIHLQKPCREMGYKRGDFPVCERQAQSILSLPIHQYLVEDQICYVTDLMKTFYGMK